jgi:hypothetical protein
MNRLRDDLREARQRFTGGADHDADLEATAMALNAVLTFLQAQGMASEAQPLIGLLGALADISTGREAPLLRPRKRGPGKPGKAHEYEAPLALASAAISLLIEEGSSEPEAAQQVARALESRFLSLPTSLRGNSQNWQALAEWRRKLHRGKKSAGIRAIYDKAKADAKENGGGAASLLSVIDELGKTAQTPPI